MKKKKQKPKPRALTTKNTITSAQKKAKQSTFSFVQIEKKLVIDYPSQFAETTYLSHLPVRTPWFVRCNVQPEFALCKFPSDHQE